MVQIVNDPNYGRSGLFEGVSSALQGLMNHKVSRMQERHKAELLQNAFKDLPAGAAAYASSLEPKEQIEFLKNISNRQRQQGQQQANPLQAMLSNNNQPSPTAPANPLQSLIDAGKNPMQAQLMQQARPNSLQGMLSQPQQPNPANVVGEYSPWPQQQAQQQQPEQQPAQLSEEDLVKHLPEFLKTPESRQVFSPEEHAALSKQFEQQPQQGLSLSEFGKSTGSDKGLTDMQKIQLQQAEQKKAESKKDVQKAYDNVKEILDSGYTGYTLYGLTPEGIKQRAKFNTLSEVFVSHMIPLLNPKGTLPRERFQYILDQAIPTSSDTDATIKGKLEGLKQIFGLNDATSSDSSAPDTASKQPPQGTVEMMKGKDIFDIPIDMVERAKKRGYK